MPKVQNPYSRIGQSSLSGSTGGQNQGLYAALMQQSGQFQRPQVDTNFTPQFSFDPVLSKLQALQEQSIANARTDAAALKKQALIDSGSGDIARSVGADENTINAASQNPFGTQQDLMKQFQDRSRQLDESLNQQNLFYSGERAKQMGELEQGRARAETGFGQNLRDLLANIDAQLQAAEEQDLQRQIEAQIAAAQNQPAGGMFGGSGYQGPGVAPPGAAPLAPPPGLEQGGMLGGVSPLVKPAADPLLLALLGGGGGSAGRQYGVAY